MLVDPKDKTKVMLYEVYTDEKAFEVHQQTPHFKKYLAEAVPLLASRERQVFTRVKKSPIAPPAARNQSGFTLGEHSNCRRCGDRPQPPVWRAGRGEDDAAGEDQRHHDGRDGALDRAAPRRILEALPLRPPTTQAPPRVRTSRRARAARGSPATFQPTRLAMSTFGPGAAWPTAKIWMKSSGDIQPFTSTA